MPPPRSETVLTLSVLDRLSNRRESDEEPFSRTQSVGNLIKRLSRDLEFLLNTRRVAVPPDEGLREVNRSLYIYGLPDFTSYSRSSPHDQARLVRHLQAVVKMFEPRLANVRIVPLEASASNTRMLRFRIEALLLMHPAPEHVAFDTVLELASGATR